MRDPLTRRGDHYQARMLEADVPSVITGRLYTTSELVDALLRWCPSPPVYGQLGDRERMDLDWSRVSHEVTDIRLEQGYLVGEIRILSTRSGQLLAKDLAQGGAWRLKLICTGMLHFVQDDSDWFPPWVSKIQIVGADVVPMHD